MASARVRLIFRLVLATLLLVLLFYAGRPLYWKISATIHDIRANKQTVTGGISQIVYEAQRSVGWLHDESDSRRHDQKAAAARRLLDLRQAYMWSRVCFGTLFLLPGNMYSLTGFFWFEDC